MFLIHPADLEQRRRACQPMARAIAARPKDLVRACSVCSSDRNVILAARDRYGIPIRTAMCLDCGLVYLVDRLTAEEYNEFYGSGEYREISSRFHRAPHSIAHVQADQLDYARKLVAALTGFVTRSGDAGSGRRLLDVGGSAGTVAREFARAFGLQPTVIDPAASEVEAARALGLEAVVGSVEEWNTDARFHLILLCRSIEHLLDLGGALRKIRSLLVPGGLFYCDINDFVQICRLVGPPEAVTKIDHCYWLCQETAPEIFRALGFEIVSINLVFQQAQVGFLLRPCEPQPCEPWPAATSAQVLLREQIRRLQEIEFAWQEYGRTPYSVADTLRRKAYRVKRRLQKLFQTPEGASARPDAAAPPPNAALAPPERAFGPPDAVTSGRDSTASLQSDRIYHG